MGNKILKIGGFGFFCPYVPMVVTPAVLGPGRRQKPPRPKKQKGPQPVPEARKPKFRSIDDPWLSF